MSAPTQLLSIVGEGGGARSGRLVPGDDGRLRLATAGEAEAGSALLISPGWVDLHTHVYDGVTQISISADRVGLDQGVHVVADAGSAGQATVRGLIEYVLPRSRTAVRVWLNIGSHGLVHLREVADPTFIDVDATLAAVEAHRDVVCGIKVRSSGIIVGAMGLQPLQLARLAARTAGLPLMVHIGEAPPPIADVLDLLDTGDVVTHSFHGKTGYPWNTDGTPVPALRRALERGVRLDVGHGAASFDQQVARRAIAAGFAPHTVSTDIHVRNIDGPVHSLAAVMTKVLDAGMPLPELVQAVTGSARAVLGSDPAWIEDGVVQHATVFEVASSAPPGRTYRDSAGVESHPQRHIVPVGTVVDGTWRACSPT